MKDFNYILKYIQPVLFFLVISCTIVFLYFIIPPKLFNYPLVEFLRIISSLFNIQMEFQVYNNTYIINTPEFLFRLSNETSGCIFNLFVTLFCIFSTVKWKQGIILLLIFLPVNFLLNVFRVLLIFTLPSDINSFYFYDIFFGLLYYILIFTLFYHYILFKIPQDPINLFSFRFLQNKRILTDQIKYSLIKSKLLKGIILVYIIISSSLTTVMIFSTFYDNKSSDSDAIDIDRSFEPPRMVRVNNTFYFVWDSENNIKTGVYSIYDLTITSEIFTQKNSPYQLYADPFIQFDKISKNFIITGICQYSGYIGDSLMRIKDEIKINQTDLSNSVLSNEKNLFLSNENKYFFNNVPPSQYNFINEYYFLLDENQNPIFFIERGSDKIEIVFSYNLTNSLTFFNGESGKYRVCKDNLNKTYFFFKSEEDYYYSLIKNLNFSTPQRLSNLIEISSEADQLNAFCDSSNVLYFVWLENQTQVFITSNKTGSFGTPQLLYNSSINISNPVTEFLDNGTGYMTFCDEDYKIYFFELNGTTIMYNQIFQDESLYSKPYIFPDMEINPDLTVALFWQRILKMDYTIAHSKNDIGFIQYLGNGIFSDLIYIG